MKDECVVCHIDTDLLRHNLCIDCMDKVEDELLEDVGHRMIKNPYDLGISAAAEKKSFKNNIRNC